jgi:PAS domain S-box-containing protein
VNEIKQTPNLNSFVLPSWVSDCELYRIQVREVTQYAMFTLDPAGTLLTWNAGVKRVLGYSEDEWLGKHTSLIFTEDDNNRGICQAEMDMAAEKEYSSDIRWHRCKDGTNIFGQGCMTALRDSTGTLLGFAKIFSDETENKKLQDSLTESNSALEQFAFVASHDLQEPLRTVSSYADLLVRRYSSQLDDEGKQFINVISSGAKRMNALVQDLLIYARVQTEQNRPASSSLDEVLETALSQLKTSIEECDAVVTHDPLPEIPADQGQMVRLFQNLVGNSLKYRKPGVRPDVHVAAREEGNTWVISVQDNGIGFDPKESLKIFRPFVRLHSHHEIPGTGVGLAICRRIVEYHGGRMWVESKAGEGATFYFSLPTEGRVPPSLVTP